VYVCLWATVCSNMSGRVCLLGRSLHPCEMGRVCCLWLVMLMVSAGHMLQYCWLWFLHLFCADADVACSRAVRQAV
jgi:hypothetical protein